MRRFAFQTLLISRYTARLVFPRNYRNQRGTWRIAKFLFLLFGPRSGHTTFGSAPPLPEALLEVHSSPCSREMELRVEFVIRTRVHAARERVVGFRST